MSNVKDTRNTATQLFIITIGALVAAFLLGQVALMGTLMLGGIDITKLNALELSVTQRQILRLGLFFNNLLLFAGSAAVALRIVFKREWAHAVQLDRAPRRNSLVYAVALFVVSLPAVAYAAYLNLQVPLPDWASRSEAATDLLLVQIMRMESLPELLVALLTIGVSAGLGEELLLRGTLQNRILGGWLGNHHLAIFLAAAIFSAMHIEFAGFLPRMLLGILLGYGYHWTKSLWVPIGLHFLFNSFQVVVAYVTGEFDPEAVSDQVPAWYLAAVSASLAAYIGYRAESHFSRKEEMPLANSMEMPNSREDG